MSDGGQPGGLPPRTATAQIASAAQPGSSAKRVALVASYAPSIVGFRGPLIRTLVDAGHEVLCLAPDLTAPILKDLAALGAIARDYPLQRTGLNPLRDAATVKALVGQFRSWRPDVVMGYTPKPAIYGSLAARLAGVPRVVPMITGLGYAFLDGGDTKQRSVRRVMVQLYRLALRASHAVIFHNKDDLRHLAGYGVLPRRLPTHVVSGSGVDLSLYPQVAMPPADQGLTFLMIARLVRYKGVAEFIEAASIVKQQAPQTRFVLVGPPESGPSGLSAQSLETMRGSVEYLGPCDDVRPHLGACHVYVLPSYGEGMPRTVLEAMATGRPIITTDARGCRETVDERVNGCLVPIGNAKALADAMLSFVARPDELEPMGRASRQKVARRFDVRLVNAQMLDILLGGATGSAGVSGPGSAVSATR